MDILFCNFTGVYEREGLERYGEFIDLKDMSGTGMYVDDEAEKSIREKLDSLSPLDRYRLRFLDNGNYHYMTRIFASYLDEPFDLITFDNHTDEKPPAFGGLKSCGSWRLDIRTENKNLRDSMLIQKREDIEKNYIPSALPLYISLDKDVLSDDVLKTNWDQGDMSEDELFSILKRLFDTRKVIGFDVCGEDLPDEPCEANMRFNEKLMDILRSGINVVI